MFRKSGRKTVIPVLSLLISFSATGQGLAGDVEIVAATARKSGNAWSFSVTLKHADTGWDHYANLWQVLTPGGELLGERVLLHPHVNEQPFTRSLSGITVPDGVNEVIIRAGDTVHGIAQQEYKLNLP
jgi:nucleoid-associated protein YgaU